MRLTYIPTIMPLTMPIQRSLSMSISELSNRIANHANDGLHLSLHYSTDYTASFRLTKSISFLYKVEMTGQMEEHGEARTFVTAQTRVSLFTYTVTFALFVLTLLSLTSPIAGLFGLLCARLVLLLVMCAPDSREEIARVLDTLD